MALNTVEIVGDFIEEACGDASSNEDYWMIVENNYNKMAGHVWYSRHCKGGAYISAFAFLAGTISGKFSLVITPTEDTTRDDCSLAELDAIRGDYKNGASMIFDFCDPKSLMQATSAIKNIFSGIQTLRKPWKQHSTVNY